MDNTSMLDATLYYYDRTYDPALAEEVLSILGRYGFFPPEKIFLGKYTRGRLVGYKPELRDCFSKAYSEKEIFAIEMAARENAAGKDIAEMEFWKFEWLFTFHKLKKLDVLPKYEPWNVLTLKTTYGRLATPKNYAAFFACYKELIAAIDPFYGNIDDVSNSVSLLSAAGELTFKPDYVQQVYWGNYFGKDHCLRYGLSKMLQVPGYDVQQIGQGVYFTLTDHATGYSSKECRHRRGVIKRYLGK